MKRMLFALIAVAVAAPVPAFAADQTKAVKAPSAVASVHCGTPNDSIQERIAKLQNELTKGEAVYSREQLKNLSSELDEYQVLLTNLTNN